MESVGRLEESLYCTGSSSRFQGLLYAVQNLLYFVCLQYTSAAAYQVLSPLATKMLCYELCETRCRGHVGVPISRLLIS